MLEARITKRVNGKGNATKAYAELIVDDCAVIRGVRLMAGKNGAFVLFPQEQAYDTATKAPKVDKNRNPVYRDIIFPLSKKSRDATVQLLLEAYKSKNNVATLDEEIKCHDISATMYEANGKKVKASGSVQVGDFVCRNILVSLEGLKYTCEEYAVVSYPSYSQATDKGTINTPYFEFKKDGSENYKALAKSIIVKAARKVSMELDEALNETEELRKERKMIEESREKEAVMTEENMQKVNSEVPSHSNFTSRGR